MLEPGKYLWALTLNPLAYFKNKFILNFKKDQSELVLKTIPGKLNMNWLWEHQASLGLHHTSGKVFYWHTHLCLLLFPCSFPHILFFQARSLCQLAREEVCDREQKTKVAYRQPAFWPVVFWGKTYGRKTEAESAFGVQWGEGKRVKRDRESKSQCQGWLQLTRPKRERATEQTWRSCSLGLWYKASANSSVLQLSIGATESQSGLPPKLRVSLHGDVQFIECP